MKKTLFLTTLALLAFGCDEGSDNNTTTVSKCGDGIVDMAAGEQCEIGVKVEATCQTYDSTKKWKDGGVPGCSTSCRLTVGTCVEVEAVCGDGLKTGAEACDKGDETPIACSEFDKTKDWKAGGAAKCSDDCKSIEQGTCEEVETEAVCGDGIWSAPSEACDKAAKTPCLLFDPSKKWKDGGLAHCSDDCKTLSKGTCEEAEAVCGDGYKNGAEVCDPEDKSHSGSATEICQELDSTKKWKEGGLAACKADCSGYEVGTCEEAEPDEEPATCGDGHKTGAEVCDTVGETRTKACSELDSTKTWQDGSVATCKNDCSGYSMDFCVEELCGNGSKDDGEACDPKDNATPEKPGTATQTCQQFDSTKNWQDGGSAKCKADCSGYEVGSCKEDTTTPAGGCTKAEDCTGDANNKLKQCIDSKCVECGENSHCDSTSKNKICDVTTHACVECVADNDCTSDTKNKCHQNKCVACKTNDDCGDGKVCNDNNKCVKDEPDANCKKLTGEGVYWCQLIDFKAELDDVTTSKDVKAYFQVGADVQASNIKARFIYNADITDVFKDMYSWMSVPDISVKSNSDGTRVASYKLTRETVTNAMPAGTTGVYYTFGVSIDNGTTWNYCKRNSDPNSSPEKLDCDVKTFTISNEHASQNQSNQNEVGKATVSNNAANIIAKFTFDVKPASFQNLTQTPIQADTKNAFLSGTAQCNSGCFSNHDSGKALNVRGWAKEANTSKNIEISVTPGDPKNKVEMEVWRNVANSPDKIKVEYSVDNKSQFKTINEALTLDGSQMKVYEKISFIIPDDAVGKTTHIRLTPYGKGQDPLRFDNIVITKSNP